ncbi:cupin domain-containing protein [Massilia sp. CFBP9026]|uniref:cupin domain-containing protein n=1 Tax=Massilia sp. CFBP9026 TaxID=3096536 RepID=UPI002A6A91DE|nr:cupin domain-containing protein [Massilia sp. CFBP9026]MDY0964668.1 cupin domain-containing protein [Massilia sp. CFBP9026]
MNDVLTLYPGGYPVHIDVPQRQVDGAGTALRFALPPRGVNFPLSHAHETKLVVALEGSLALRTGANEPRPLLRPGQAMLLEAGTAHRIAQYGDRPALVGIALWPGAVEEAFRLLERMVAQRGFEHAAVAALFARYGVRWDAAIVSGGHAAALDVTSFRAAARALPPALRERLADCWREWLPPA